MDDSQSPPDGENRADDRKGDAGRRTSLRLSDAEHVAANRRDMFGDGSLLDALAGRPLPREEGESGLPADAAMPAEPAAPVDEPPLTDGTTAPDIAHPAVQAAEPEAAESLDAIIDSFSAAPPDAASEQFQVSSIFAGLGSPPPHGDGNGQPAQSQGDASLREDDGPPGPEAPHAAAPRRQAAAPPGLGVPLFYGPLAAPPEPSNWPPATAAGDAPASEAGEPLEPPADWPPQAADAAADGQPAAFEPARRGGSEPFPEPLGWPPFMDPPGTQADDADAPPLLEPPALVRGISEPPADASTSPFPGPPAWPPFPGSPGSDAALSGPEPAGLPPYIELPAHPGGDEEPPAPPAPEAFTEPGAAPSFRPPPAFAEASAFEPPPFPTPRGMRAFADRPGGTARPEQQEPPGFDDIDASPPGLGAAARVQATAKIAAEANATAQALDNLQRLLTKTVASSAAQPQPSYPHRTHHAPFHLPQDDPFANEMAMLPLPVPPSERAGSRNVYLLGFLTGLVLSVMAGAALYFLINTG